MKQENQVTPSTTNTAARELLTDAERGVIETLLNAVYAAWNLADNTEDAGDITSVTVERGHFEDLSERLDALDALPDDQPEYTMAAAAKARWALRRLLDPTLTQQQGGEQEAVDGLPAKWRAEAGAFGDTCSDRDRGYARTLCQLAKELDRELPFITFAGWQAVETAPRDGSKVLLAWSDGVCVGWFQQRTSNQSRSPWRRDLFGLGDTIVGAEPTHWVPLPSGPATAIVSRWREEALAGFGYSNSSYESGHISGKRHCADELEAALRTKQPAASEGDGIRVERAEYFSPTEGGHFLRVVYRWPHNGKLLRHTQFVELHSKDQVEHLIALLNTSKQAAEDASKAGDAVACRHDWQPDQDALGWFCCQKCDVSRKPPLTDPTPPRHPADEVRDATCGHCRGTGEVPRLVQHASGDPQDAYEAPSDCPSCGGTGAVTAVNSEQCVALYDAVMRSGMTRDVKTPERKTEIVRAALQAGTP